MRKGKAMATLIEYIIKYIQLIRISDLIDIVIVAFIIYHLINWIRETRAVQLVKGIILLFALLLLSDWTNLTVLNYLLNGIIQVGMFAVVVIFQPELRSLLEKLGHSKVGKIMDLAINNSTAAGNFESIQDEICTAVSNMSASKTGALIVIEGETRLGDSIRTGTEINASITSALLENIFVPNTPLHDGAVIIRDSVILSAGCFLPLTSNYNLSRELGTRHRAALGMSEASDALIIVVSEETGKVSIALRGSLTRNINKESLKKVLWKFMSKEDKQDSLDKVKFWKLFSKNTNEGRK